MNRVALAVSHLEKALNHLEKEANLIETKLDQKLYALERHTEEYKSSIKGQNAQRLINLLSDKQINVQLMLDSVNEALEIDKNKNDPTIY